MRTRVFGVCVTPLLLVSAVAAAQTSVPLEPGRETYQSAAIDANGNLGIVRTSGATLTVPKAGEQRSFSTPVLSASKTAVGAQAMFPNCCTSYDVPLQLIVYAAGRVHRFTGTGLPIFQWAFVDGGARVAYGQEPVHFGCETHYELRDVGSERLVEAVDVPQPCGLNPDPKPVRVPPWVADLISQKGAIAR
jgi:hypothetical protein